jgi:Lrp/AsnC family transcriptional regulator
MIDKIDLLILRLLQKDGRLTYRELSKKVNLSVTPIHERVKRLEKEGYISKYVALLSREKLGKGLTIYCQVTLIKQTKEVSSNFNKVIKDLPEVLECNFISGSFDYLLKIITPDMDGYHRFHQEKLSVIEGVSLINSFFVMSEVKSTTELPI